jgi:hypothetical protein
MSYSNRSGFTFDPWNTAQLTQLVNRPLESRFEGISTLGEQIAPLFSVQGREVSISAREVLAFGQGQYRSPNATPPLVELDAEVTRSKIELVLLDEMRRIDEETWLNLNSSDERIRAAAGVSLVETGQILALRNRRLTETLRWEAFSGEANIVYNKGKDSEATLTIDYGIPSANKVNANVDWSDHANSTPITDLKAWLKLPTYQVGVAGTKIHLSSEAWDHLIQSQEIVGYLTGSDRGLLIPTRADVEALLPAGTSIIVDDTGFRDEDQGTNRNKSALNRYLPIDKVLITTDYTIDGERIADMPDGLVTVANSYNSTSIIQGATAEVKLDQMSLTHFMRYASARIPRINHPGAFVWADVGAFTE